MNLEELIRRFKENSRFDFRVELYLDGYFYQNQRFTKYAKTREDAITSIENQIMSYNKLGYNFTINKIEDEPF